MIMPRCLRVLLLNRLKMISNFSYTRNLRQYAFNSRPSSARPGSRQVVNSNSSQMQMGPPTMSRNEYASTLNQQRPFKAPRIDDGGSRSQGSIPAMPMPLSQDSQTPIRVQSEFPILCFEMTSRLVLL